MKTELDDTKLKELERKADEGSITATQTLLKIQREKALEQKKKELLGQAMFDRPEDEEKERAKALRKMPSVGHLEYNLDELDITEIELFIQKGDFKSLPEHMTVYLNWMQEAHDWYYKFKSRTWVLKFLIANCQDADGNSISYYMADKIFNDMLGFFYADKNFKRNSWYRYLAERIEIGAALALEDNDFDTYAKNLERAAKVASMITVEKRDIDPRLMDRRPRFFITKTDELGLPRIDRYKLAKQIDEMDIADKDKLRLKQDLGTEERDFFMDVEEEESDE